jgi:hypothetical protein
MLRKPDVQVMYFAIVAIFFQCILVEALFVILYVRAVLFAVRRKIDRIVSYLGKVNIVEQQWKMLKKI